MAGFFRHLSKTSVVTALLAVTTPSFGHAPPEGSSVRWFMDGDTEVTVVRTNRGFIFSRDDGKTFRMLCPYAFGATLTEPVPYGITADARLLLGTYQKGLVTASRDLCTFEPLTGTMAGAGLLELETITAVPRSFAAIASTDDHLYVNVDDGKTWAARPVKDFLFTLKVAPSDPLRFYATSFHEGDGGTPLYQLASSANAGSVFSTTTVPLTADETGLSVVGVDADDPKRAYLRTIAIDPLAPERLLRTDDAGATVTEVLAARGPFVIESLPGGPTWLGTGDALMRSTDRGKTFTAVTAAAMSLVGCVEEHAGKLYVCGYFEGEFGVRVSADSGETFSWFLRFPQVDAQVDCPSSSPSISECVQLWHDWQVEQGQLAGSGGTAPSSGGGGGAGAAGGTPPAGSSGGGGGYYYPISGGTAGTPTEPTKDSGCGCRFETRTTAAPGLIATLVALLGALRRKRR